MYVDGQNPAYRLTAFLSYFNGIPFLYYINNVSYYQSISVFPTFLKYMFVSEK